MMGQHSLVSAGKMVPYMSGVGDDVSVARSAGLSSWASPSLEVVRGSAPQAERWP